MVAEEIVNNDDTALRNMVSKVKKSNDIMEKLVFNYSTLTSQQKVDLVYQLCNLNNSLRTQSASLKSANDDYRFRKSFIQQTRRNTVSFEDLLFSVLKEYRISLELISKISTSSRRELQFPIIQLEV